jgi:hypothetical protein
MTIKRNPTIWEECQWQREMDERVRIAIQESAHRDKVKSRWVVVVWILAALALTLVLGAIEVVTSGH